MLHSFSGSPSDGANPYYVGLIADKHGALYGTAYNGGSGGCEFNGCGTVFRLPPSPHRFMWKPEAPAVPIYRN